MTEHNNYLGWRRWTPSAEEWINFYADQSIPFELNENEYLLVESDGGSTLTYCFEDGKLRKVSGGAIKTFIDKSSTEESVESTDAKSTRRAATKKTKYSKGKSIVLTPRNIEQICAFDLVKDHSKTIKLITGTWGTGKTMIMVNAALEALKDGVFEKIIWIRNNVDVKGTKDMGALPGDELEKLFPFLGPFRDHAGDAAVKTMLTKGTLVVEPLQFLRGRNFENTLIMCSECENLTKEHIQLIIARAAEGSEVWFDGDTRQRDAAIFEKSQGVEQMIEKFTNKPLFGYVHLTKSERSETAAMADLLN